MAATEHALGAVVHEFVRRLLRRAPLLDVQIEPAGRDVFSQLTAGRLDLLVVPKVGRLPEELFEGLWALVVSTADVPRAVTKDEYTKMWVARG